MLSQHTSKIFSERLTDEDYRRSPPPLDIRKFRANNTQISQKDSELESKGRGSTKMFKESQSSKEILYIPLDNDKGVL